MGSKGPRYEFKWKRNTELPHSEQYDEGFWSKTIYMMTSSDVLMSWRS